MPADLVLSPVGRVARFRSSQIVAILSQGFNDNGYRHPTIELCCLAADGSTSSPRLTLRYQQHNGRGHSFSGFSSDEVRYRAARGFMRIEPGWSHAYGCAISASAQYSGEFAFLRRCLDLLDKARECKSLKRTDGRYHPIQRVECDALRDAVLLRHAGVEIRVYSEAVRKARSRRQLDDRAAQRAA